MSVSVAAVEEHERMVADVVDGRRVGLVNPLGQNRAGIRGVGEHVGKRVARGRDFEALALARSESNERSAKRIPSLS